MYARRREEEASPQEPSVSKNMKRAVRRDRKQRKRGRQGSNWLGDEDPDERLSGFPARSPSRSQSRNLTDDLFGDIDPGLEDLESDNGLFDDLPRENDY